MPTAVSAPLTFGAPLPAGASAEKVLEAAFHSLQHAYAASLDWALRHRLITLLTLLAVVAVNLSFPIAVQAGILEI